MDKVTLARRPTVCIHHSVLVQAAEALRERVTGHRTEKKGFWPHTKRGGGGASRVGAEPL